MPRSEARIGTRSGAVLVVAALVLGACSSPRAEQPTTTAAPPVATTLEPTTTTAPPPPPPELAWAPCGEDLECTTMPVPLDWSRPDGEEVVLALSRRPATDPTQRIGSLLVNPGGPGASGLRLLRSGISLGAEVLARFDVVSWDPRGVGESTSLSCGSRDEAYLLADPDPRDAAGRAARDEVAAALAEECRHSDAELLPHLGTDAGVRDLEQIRRALGAEPLNYLGYSYGTLLGLAYAETYPEHVRAMVLDGIVDPALDLEGLVRGQALAFEATVERLLASCAAPCPAGVSPDEYDRLAEHVRIEPIPAADGRVVGPAELFVATVMATYRQSSWEVLHRALAQALAGDGTGVMQLADAYRQLVHSVSTYLAVLCVDWEGLEDPARFSELAEGLRELAPRMGPGIGHELVACAHWAAPVTRTPGPVRAPGTPPLLVVGTTGDAATPYDQAVRVAEELDHGVLVTREGEGHTAVGSDACVDELVTRYLVDRELPPPGTTC